MKLLQVKPQVYKFETCKEFAETFNIGEGDFVLTNDFIYTPAMGELNLKADVLFQEKYGTGEPSDEMINAIMKDMEGK
ncbi:MAG: 4-hydroxybutyrate dehydrogenase, partial [Clostridium sp.]